MFIEFICGAGVGYVISIIVEHLRQRTIDKRRRERGLTRKP